MKKVLVTARSFGNVSVEPIQILQEAGLEMVEHPKRGPLTKEEMLPLIQDAAAVIVGTDRIDREIMTAGSQLEVVAKHGVGVDNIDLESAADLGIKVAFTPGANTGAVAEMALGFMLSLSRNLTTADAKVRRGEWGSIVGRELAKKTVGIVGFGAIGRYLTQLLKGFGCCILAYDPYIDEDAAAELGVSVVSLGELLQNADYVTLHVPNTPETKNMIDKEALATMKPDAFLINMARGGVVNDQDLAAALADEVIAGAAVDVFEQEPPAADHPLLHAPRIIVSPHMGAHSREAMNNMSVMAAANVAAVLSGRPCPNLVK